VTELDHLAHVTTRPGILMATGAGVERAACAPAQYALCMERLGTQTWLDADCLAEDGMHASPTHILEAAI